MAKHNPSNATTARRHGLQVIGAGLPRTSTASLQTGLEILGFRPCYHTITDLLPNAHSQGPLWLAAMREPSAPARQKLLAEVTKGYSAIVDGPGCFFVQDWIEMYPDAKVVLGLRRSPEIWLASVNGSIAKVFGRGVLYWLAYFVPEMYFGFTMNNLWEAQTRKKYDVSVMTEEYYRLHNQYIRSIVPSDRLLEFQANDGWGPLAKFLGKPVSFDIFPHKNDSKAANGLIKSFVVYGVGVWIAVFACGFVIIKGSILYLNTQHSSRIQLQ